MQYLHHQISCKLLSFTLKDLVTNDQCSSITTFDRQYLPNQTYPYNILPWEWIDLKLHVQWKYLSYRVLVFADTAFLRGMAELCLVVTFQNQNSGGYSVLDRGHNTSNTVILQRGRYCHLMLWLLQYRHCWYQCPIYNPLCNSCGPKCPVYNPLCNSCLYSFRPSIHIACWFQSPNNGLCSESLENGTCPLQ